jgi:hypothetical protein
MRRMGVDRAQIKLQIQIETSEGHESYLCNIVCAMMVIIRLDQLD